MSKNMRSKIAFAFKKYIAILKYFKNNVGLAKK
jgi:hypothetical protein